jgi:hypothetical protein
LLLGVNAHINYDLIFTLTDMLAPEWPRLDPAGRQLRYRDHCLVNRIIYQSVNAVQDQVIERYQPALDLVDLAFGPLDEWLVYRLLGTWREEVWRAALRYLKASDDLARSLLRRQVESRALQRARAILTPRGPAALLDLL